MSKNKSTARARARKKMLAALPEDAELRAFVDAAPDTSPRTLLAACPRADWALSLAIATGYPVGALLSAMADLMRHAGASPAVEVGLRLARDELGWLSRRGAIPELEALELGASADRAALALARGAPALRASRAKRAREPRIEGTVQELVLDVLEMLLEDRYAPDEGGAFRGQDRNAVRLRAMQELAPPLLHYLARYERHPSPLVGLRLLAGATLAFAACWLLVLGAMTIGWETVAALFAGVVLGLVAIGVGGAKLGGEGMAVIAFVAVLGLPVGVHGGPGIVRGLFFSARQIPVAEAPAHSAAPWFSFVDARVATDASVQTRWEFRTSLRQRRFRRTALAPIVGDDWNADMPVPAWAICGDTVDANNDLERHIPACRETWSRSLEGGRPTTIGIRDIESALAEVERRHGLRSARDAPVLVWTARPEELAAREAFLMLFIIGSAWLLSMLLVAVPRFRRRRRRKREMDEEWKPGEA